LPWGRCVECDAFIRSDFLYCQSCSESTPLGKNIELRKRADEQKAAFKAKHGIYYLSNEFMVVNCNKFLSFHFIISFLTAKLMEDGHDNWLSKLNINVPKETTKPTVEFVGKENTQESGGEGVKDVDNMMVE
jgi:hypothetical protein